MHFYRICVMKTVYFLIAGLCLQTVLALTAMGCSKVNIAIPPAPDSLPSSFLSLGDSYTIGESVGSSDRFPAQTTAILQSKGIAAGTPRYIAKTGWTTANLLDAVKNTTLLPKYELVTLLIGVNDQFQGLDTGSYRKRFTELLDKAIGLTGSRMNHVFVLSIPDYGVTAFGGGSKKISKEIDDFNAINKSVTGLRGATYIDITPISRLVVNDQSLTANDGLHPSAKQYLLWAQPLADAMQAVLK